MSNYDKLISVLEEVFQLNQADLDFGIYRILNQKREEIADFLRKRLVPQVKEVIAEANVGDLAALQDQLSKLIATLNEAGVEPESSSKVKELREKIRSTPSAEGLENEIFSHLASFFKRYYKDGDFISMRRYKKDVYAIPYEGEEVKLYWANHDQYYIKTSEYLKNYAFKLADGRLVRFELAEASTEKDNRKEESGKERRFRIFEEKPVEANANTLTVFFTYEPTDKKAKKDDLNKEATAQIKKHLPADWAADVLQKMPTEKDKDRTLLDKHIQDFTTRNTFDYFIHKDLGGFLSRELDFYIKNEVLHLDDINTDSAADFQKQLVKVHALKEVGGKIITFLAQLENFQKKLWLKKKFVVDTQYCITLDRIPEAFYPEIAANAAQREEWVRLFAIDEIEADLVQPGYSVPLTVDFLKSQPFLVLDTAFFSEEFKLRLIATMENLDEQLDGLLINSENFQALNLLKKRYFEKVKCIYVDPPYNTGEDGFAYKDNYQHSSWQTFLFSRFLLSKEMLSSEGLIFSSIDDLEYHRLRLIFGELFGDENFIDNIIWKKRYGGGPKEKYLVSVHEYILFFAKNILGIANIFVPLDEESIKRYYTNKDENFNLRGPYRTHPLEATKSVGRRENLIYPIPAPDGTDVLPTRQWWWEKERTYEALKRGELEFLKSQDGTWTVHTKQYLKDEKGEQRKTKAQSIIDSVYTQHGTSEIASLFADSRTFLFPKPSELIKKLLEIGSQISTDIILDYFAGSGTTGHAVINLNREDNGNRKYILVEMGQYFDTVTKPRIQKVIYSEDWKDGKPVSRKGSSHAFKYLRLESYEDTLNNLQMKRKSGQQQFLELSDSFQEEYMLSYMLDVESEGSLLNVAAFENPFDYQLRIIKDNEAVPTRIDLVETFNYLIGLRVKTSERIRGFHVVTGESLSGEQILVIWRNLREKSNADLDAFFQKQQYNTRDREFDRIYVNGDNNLENLKIGDEQWKVVLIEEEFLKRMFEVEDV